MSAPAVGALAAPSAVIDSVVLRTPCRICSGAANPYSVMAGVENACSKSRATPKPIRLIAEPIAAGPSGTLSTTRTAPE